jgi:nitroimidazol reductase NimA-like FMN-containing flavoprotein (pyridoxamine 5'-phosphate oxidase superfamily)
MSDRTAGKTDGSPAHLGPGRDSVIPKPVLERLDEAGCLRLISPGGFGRLAYSGRFGLAVIPVNYKLHEGSIVSRIAQDSPTDEGLRTGIKGAEYKVAFEIDHVDRAA